MYLLCGRAYIGFARGKICPGLLLWKGVASDCLEMELVDMRGAVVFILGNGLLAFLGSG